MATIVDSLVLELGIDSSKFTAAQQEAMSGLRNVESQLLRSGNTFESEGKKLNNFFENLKREALGILGVFLGGKAIKDFVEDMTNLEAATGRLSKQMGTSTEVISGWQGAFKQIGGTAEDANSALAGLNSEITKFTLTGQSGMLPVLSRLGVGLYDQNHQLKTSAQLWLDIAQAVQGMDPRQATAFLQMIPGANQAMINFALLGRSAMEGYVSEAQKAFKVTQDNADQASRLQKSWSLLESSVINVGKAISDTLTPALVPVLDKFRSLFQGWTADPKSPEAKAAAAATSHEGLAQRFGDPRAFVEFLIGPRTATQLYGPKPGTSGETDASDIVLPSTAGLGEPWSPTNPAIQSDVKPGARTRATTSNVTRSSRGGNSTVVTTSIGQINVNAPQAKDAEGVAREIGPALRRSVEAGAANGGPQ